jgi:hypothetical protein
LLNAVSWSTVGPPLMNIRPWCPSDSQVTSDCGPPDRSDVRGAAVSGVISSLTVAKVLFMVCIANFTTTPLSIAVVSTTSSVATITAETLGGAKRSSRKSRKWTSRRTSWPASTTPNSTTNDRAVVNG